MMIDWQDIKTAPYSERILLRIDGGNIHTGRKFSKKYVIRPGYPDERFIVKDEFEPVGVYATYDADPFFDSEPTAWAKL